MHVCVHLLPFLPFQAYSAIISLSVFSFSSPSALHSSSFCLTNPTEPLWHSERWRCIYSIGPCTCCCHSNWILMSVCPPTHYLRDAAVLKLGELREKATILGEPKTGCKESRWMFYWSERVSRAAGLCSCHVVLIVLVIVATGTGNCWRSGFTDMCFCLSLSLSCWDADLVSRVKRSDEMTRVYCAGKNSLKMSLDRVSLHRCIGWIAAFSVAAHRCPQLLYDCLMHDVYPKICTSALIGNFQESGSKILLI